jgi:AraC-like DNA-binding protein
VPRLKLSNDVIDQIRAMHARKWPAKRIAQKLGLSDTSVYKVLNPIRADFRARQTPAEYRDTETKQAIRLLSSEIQERRDNLRKRKLSMLKKELELGAMEMKIDELVRQREALWKKHKGVTQPCLATEA